LFREQVKREGIALSHSRLTQTGDFFHGVARALSRRKFFFQPVAAADLTPHSDIPREWKVSGPIPQFLLKPVTGAYPGGWIQIQIRLSFKSEEQATPLLYFEDENGSEHIEELELRDNRHIKEYIFLPPRIGFLKLLPGSRSGTLSLDSIALREVSREEVYCCRFPRYLWRKLTDPGTLDLIRRGLQIWREHGAGLLLKRFWSAVAGNRESSSFAYNEWTLRFDTLTEVDREAIQKHIQTFSSPPKISILVSAPQSSHPFLAEAIDSVRRQLYPHWELWLCSASSPPEQDGTPGREEDPRIRFIRSKNPGDLIEALNRSLSEATGDWVVFLEPDALLAEHALYHIAFRQNTHLETQVIYSDEDQINGEGRRCSPHFKPDWNPDLFYSCNYIGGMLAIRRNLIQEAGGFRQEYQAGLLYDLLLRCLGQTAGEPFFHIPALLYQSRQGHGHTPDEATNVSASHAEEEALKEFFAKREETVQVGLHPGGFTRKISYSLSEPTPLVDILIPTRNHHQMLDRCLRSIREQTDYPNYRITVINNQSDYPKSLNYLEELARDPQIRVLDYDRPFNFSAINNFAAKQSEGSLLCLMNNDVEATHPEWLREMASHALRPEIGAVGCLLLYPDRTVQHAGVILGVGGIAGHAHKHFPAFSRGYCSRLQALQNVSAVTAACLVVRREVYEQLGGFDEQFRVALNDVDFCLRVREAGYRNLYTPFARLIHHESQTRGPDDTAEKWDQFKCERDLMLRRWGDILKQDPFYNPNLSLDFEDFRIASFPQHYAPWI